MEALGARLGRTCGDLGKLGLLVFLKGDLGAGKTTLVRGFIHAFDYKGHVKSPTYTLVEPYELSGFSIYHFDFYRLTDSVELEYMGVQDYFHTLAICLVEWPERANDYLPPADIIIDIRFEGEGRTVGLVGFSEAGHRIVSAMDDQS
jgi:tRNA threonylcarbamoyladenosine biosynthesis protein TsaE